MPAIHEQPVMKACLSLSVLCLVCHTALGQEFVISDVTVVDVDGGRLIGQRDVAIRGGRIVEISATSPVRSIDSIDGNGLFLVPALWNFHAHLTMEEEAGYAESSLNEFVPNGVLYTVDMGGELDRLESWRSAIQSRERIGPTILVAGPFIDGEKDLDGSLAVNAWRRRSMEAVQTPDEAANLVRALSSRVDLLKVHSRIPRSAYFAVAEQAGQTGKPLAVHLPVGVSIRDAVESGATTIEHTISFLEDAIYMDDPQAMQSAWSSMMVRLRGREGAALFDYIAAEGTCVTPTLLSTVRIARDMESEFFSAAADDLEWITLQLFRSGVKLIAGSDAGSEAAGISQAEDLLLELEHLAEIGIPPGDVLRIATANAASCLGLQDHGLVENGAEANLLLLRANPLEHVGNLRQLDAAVLAGRYFDSAEMQRLD